MISLALDKEEEQLPLLRMSKREVDSNDDTSSDEGSDSPSHKKHKPNQKTDPNYEITIGKTPIFRVLTELIKPKTNCLEKEEDIYDIYGKLLAMKLRTLSSLESQELMYKIDRMYLNLRWQSGTTQCRGERGGSSDPAEKI